MNIQKNLHYQQLQKSASAIQQQHLLDLFAKDQSRQKKYFFQLDQLMIDLSRNFIDEEIIQQLISFADGLSLSKKIADLFQGNIVNFSENRPALHTALRADFQNHLHDERYISIANEFARMKKLFLECNAQQCLGYTNKAINTIVHLGIGGSDLGPKLLHQVLNNNQKIKINFISTSDGIALHELLNELDPERTLFFITSKSFSTTETIIHARKIKNWFTEKSADPNAFTHHCYGISVNERAMTEFGITKEKQFLLWDFIGGRFSIWSSVSLSAILASDFSQFEEFLLGAREVDMHFCTAPLRNNIPVLMSLITFWYTHFFAAQTQLISPYHEKLRLLPEYLQQLFMESLGKSVDINGEYIAYTTGNIYWGSLGANAQHAYYQLLHQGKHFIPIDFIIPQTLEHADSEYEQLNFANALAQAQALMCGNHQINQTINHQTHLGNRPSNLIIFKKLTPRVLGNLLALYEHQVYTLSVLFNINAFDQYGVELGKQTAAAIQKQFDNADVSNALDPATQALLDWLNKT